MDHEFDIQSLKEQISDYTKILNENIELKRQNKHLIEKVKSLKQKKRILKNQNKEYEEKCQNDGFKIKNLELEISNLKKKNVTLKRSLSQKSIALKSEISSDFKIPIEKSKSMSETIAFQDQQANDVSNNNNIFSDSKLIQDNDNMLKMKKTNRKRKILLFDDYFKEDNEPIIQFEREKDQDDSPFNKFQDNSNNKHQENAEDQNEINLIQSSKNSKITKIPNPKKATVLPQPQSIPDLLADIKNADMDQIDTIVIRVLAESYPSVTALKRRYLDLLNSFAVSIKTTPTDSDEIYLIISFFVKFSLRISPETLERFKNSVKSNQKLSTILSTIEETNDVI